MTALRRILVATLVAALTGGLAIGAALLLSAGVAAAVPVATMSTPLTGAVGLDPTRELAK